MSSSSYPLPILNDINYGSIDWNDRQALQNRWTPPEKGWLIAVEWKATPYGLGAFAAQHVPVGTPVRVGVVGKNMISFHNRQDIENFVTGGTNNVSKEDPEYQARIKYLSDYLFGNYQYKDNNDNVIPGAKDEWIYCILVPGFGTNHSENPNVRIYSLRMLETFLTRGLASNNNNEGVVMVASRNIAKGEEICNSYSYCGVAPDFVRDFAEEHQVTMVFPGCNDFVK